MLKWFTYGLSGGFVLLSGLVSCHAENKTTDFYTPPPPQLRTPAGEMGLKEWEASPARILDLQDSFDFSGAAPANFTVRAQCQRQDEVFSTSKSFSQITEVRLFQIVPDEILNRDLKTGVFPCAFEFNLFSSSGSNHVLNLPFTNIEDSRPGQISVAHEPETASPGFRTDDLAGVRARFANRGLVTLELNCANFKTLPLPFESVLDLAHFDFPKNQDPLAQTLKQHPMQNCRAVAMQQGLRQEISRLFQLRFPQAAFTIQITQNPYTEPQDSRERQEALLRLLSGQDLLLEEWSVTNNSETPRSVRVSARALNAQINMYELPKPGLPKGDKMIYSPKPWVRAYLGPGIAYGNSGAFTTAIIPPGQSLRFSLRIQAPGKLNNYFEIFQGGTVQISETAILEEVSEQGEVLGTYPFAQNQELFLTGLDPAFIAQFPQEPGMIGWP